MVAIALTVVGTLLLAAGVVSRSFASDPWLEDGRVRGAVFETKSGPLLIEADVVVERRPRDGQANDLVSDPRGL